MCLQAGLDVSGCSRSPLPVSVRCVNSEAPLIDVFTHTHKSSLSEITHRGLSPPSSFRKLRELLITPTSSWTSWKLETSRHAFLLGRRDGPERLGAFHKCTKLFILCCVPLSLFTSLQSTSLFCWHTPHTPTALWEIESSAWLPVIPSPRCEAEERGRSLYLLGGFVNKSL